jgi:hypothetical protein
MTTISNTADHATEHVKHAASHVGSSLLDLSTQVIRFANGVREAQGRGVETMLGRLGLQRRQGALGPVLWFAAGAVAAATAVLLLSPTTGPQLRRRITAFIGRETEPNAGQPGVAEPRIEEPEVSAQHNGAQHATG